MPAPVWWLLCLPLVAGAFMPLQAGINGQLAKHVSSVLAAACISFSCWLASVVVAGISAARGPQPGCAQRANVVAVERRLVAPSLFAPPLLLGRALARCYL